MTLIFLTSNVFKDLKLSLWFTELRICKPEVFRVRDVAWKRRAGPASAQGAQGLRPPENPPRRVLTRVSQRSSYREVCASAKSEAAVLRRGASRVPPRWPSRPPRRGRAPGSGPRELADSSVPFSRRGF